MSYAYFKLYYSEVKSLVLFLNRARIGPITLKLRLLGPVQSVKKFEILIVHYDSLYNVVKVYI